MALFRQKPIKVEAVQWTGANLNEMITFTGGAFVGIDPRDGEGDPDLTAKVYDRLHSTWVRLRTGDWIIRGVHGEFYPCAGPVFAETYDRL